MQELTRKGVSRSNIDNALQDVFEGNNCFTEPSTFLPRDEEAGSETVEEDVPQGFNMESWTNLKDAATRKWRQDTQLGIEARRRRFTSWLLRRGYGYSLVTRLMKDMSAPE